MIGSKIRLFTYAAGATAVLASCGANGDFDPDLRGLMRGGLETSQAAARAQPRPAPDSRGLITYPDYQVAVAQPGDTAATIAARLGLNAGQLAQYNALEPNAPLASGALIALPGRVAPGSSAAGTGQSANARSAASNSTRQTSGAQPRQHRVVAGETAWSIARKYGVNVADLAQWNGLPADMTIRTGQRLLIPVTGRAAPSGSSAARRRVVSAPGVGSPTPQPPSAAQPLPNEATRPVATPVENPGTPNLGATRTTASGNGRFQMPVNGSIIRTYAKGRNEGIDISAAPGTEIKAAGPGIVAAITRDTEGVPIIVIRHDDDFMTVYAGLDALTIKKGDTVKVGQVMGKASASGVIHFEIRRGFESVNPEDFLM